VGGSPPPVSPEATNIKALRVFQRFPMAVLIYTIELSQNTIAGRFCYFCISSKNPDIGGKKNLPSCFHCPDIGSSCLRPVFFNRTGSCFYQMEADQNEEIPADLSFDI